MPHVDGQGSALSKMNSSFYKSKVVLCGCPGRSECLLVRHVRSHLSHGADYISIFEKLMRFSGTACTVQLLHYANSLRNFQMQILEQLQEQLADIRATICFEDIECI